MKHKKPGVPMGFRWKLTLSYLLIVTLAMGASLVSLMSVSNRHQRRQAEIIFDNAADGVCHQALNRVGAINSVLLLLTQDETLTRIMNADYYSTFEKAQDVLYVLDPIMSILYTNYKEIVGYEVYTNGGIAGCRSNYIPFAKADERAQARNIACAIEPYWQYEDTLEDTLVKTYLTVSRKCVYQGTLEESAVVTLYLNAQTLLRDILPDNGLPAFVRIADERGQAFYTAGECAESGDAVFSAERKMAGTGWSVYVRMDASAMMISAPEAIRLPLIILLCVLAAIVLVSILLARNFSMRIQRLQLQLRQVVPSAFHIDISADRQDEIGDIANSVGEMIRETRHVLLEGYQNRIARREAQIIALQAQINPHFLFNTLSNLNWRVLKKGDMEMSRIITQLSKFYYVSLNDGKKLSTVRGELKHMDIYLQIQSAIRGETVRTTLEIDEAALDTSMPGVILQPLVENAIEHGVGAVGFEKGMIWLRVKDEPEEVRITLRDNGPGIPPEVIASLHAEGTLGYGLKNVDKRLKLYYGEERGLIFRSPPEGGAEITLRIPKQTPEREETTRS